MPTRRTRSGVLITFVGTQRTVWSRSRYTRRPGSLSTRLGIVLRWPIGLVLISWRYLWRITPVYRREEDGGPDDLPPPIPDGVETGDSRVSRTGTARCCTAGTPSASRVPAARREQVVALLAADPNSAAPQDAAVFVKSKEAGDTSCGEMQVGDEYVVRMPGPWDGPVRVVHRTPTSFGSRRCPGIWRRGRSSQGAVRGVRAGLRDRVVGLPR